MVTELLGSLSASMLSCDRFFEGFDTSSGVSAGRSGEELPGEDDEDMCYDSTILFIHCMKLS